MVGGEQRPLAARKVDGRAGGRSSFFFFRQIFLPSPSHCALIGFSLVGEITNCPPVTKWCNCLVIQTTASQVQIGGGGRFCSQLRPSHFLFPSLSPIFGTWYVAKDMIIGVFNRREMCRTMKLVNQARERLVQLLHQPPDLHYSSKRLSALWEGED